MVSCIREVLPRRKSVTATRIPAPRAARIVARADSPTPLSAFTYPTTFSPSAVRVLGLILRKEARSSRDDADPKGIDSVSVLAELPAPSCTCLGRDVCPPWHRLLLALDRARLRRRY